MTITSNEQLIIYAITFDGDTPPTREMCRSLVEGLIQEYLADSQKIKLEFDHYGRPSILGYDHLAISYAHSKTQLIIGVHPSAKKIGIDTEPLSRLDDIYELRKSAFSESENRVLSREGYVTAWCMKEAAVKQFGKGFRESDPSELTMKTSCKSYKLYLKGNVIQDGYFLSIILGDDAIVACADAPMKTFSLQRRTLKDILVKE